MNFTIKELELSGILLITSKLFRDDRGHFQEIFKNSVLNVKFQQCNFSFSQKNVIRGLHYQESPHAQGKLIVPITGHVQDVVVDLRKNSPTFLQHLCVELKCQESMLYVPEGFAHGFAVKSESAHVMYMCTQEYNPHAERGIKFDDPQLNIPWAVTQPILSEKDRKLPLWNRGQV